MLERYRPRVTLGQCDQCCEGRSAGFAGLREGDPAMCEGLFRASQG